MRVLRHTHRLVRPGGTVLDLTSIAPAASIEHAGTLLGQLEQDAFLARAAITEAAVDRFVADGELAEEARVELDVLKHFDSGLDMLADADGRAFANVPPALEAQLRSAAGPVVERSRCLLRRLRVL